MNYKQFEEQVESIENCEYKYRVWRDENFIIVEKCHKGYVNCVQGICEIPLNRQYVVAYDTDVINECTKVPRELGSLITEFISTPVDERMPKKEYLIKVLPSECGYLIFAPYEKVYILGNPSDWGGIKAYFTQSEINKLKQRDDIAIDWDKAVLEEVQP